MSDEFRPADARNDRPPNPEPMDDRERHELLQRLVFLESEQRRWRAIALGALTTVLLLIVLGGVFSVGSAIVLSARSADTLRAEQEAVMRERDAAEMAQRHLEESRQQAEKARVLAQQALEKAKEDAAK